MTDAATHVRITPDERESEQLSSEHLDRAVASLRTHGYVVLERAVDESHLDALRSKMRQDSELLLRFAEVAPGLFWSARGGRRGHLQQSIPRSPPWVFRDIVCNQLVDRVSAALLGDGAFFGFPQYCCNVNCPGSVDQEVHFDPGPPGALAVNIALRGVGADDGAIELWPGSHREETSVTAITAHERARRRELAPPVRGTTSKGDILIRDLRLWHRGRANPSTTSRHMLAILHYPATAAGDPRSWAAAPTSFARACEPAFRGSRVRPCVRFTDIPIAYLATGPASEVQRLVEEHPWFHSMRRAVERAGQHLGARS